MTMTINFVLNNDAHEAARLQVLRDQVACQRAPFASLTSGERDVLVKNLDDQLRYLLDTIKFHLAQMEPVVSRETLKVGDWVRHKPTGRKWTIIQLDEA